MNIIFDGNYLFHKTFSVFSSYHKNKDMCEILQDKEQRQVMIRKCIIDMCYALARFKKITKVVFVIDSHSWRYNLHDDYKYALTKVRDPYYKHFMTLLDEFESLLRKRGLIVSRVKGAEGDDLLYLWGNVYYGFIMDEEVTIITGDSDIRMLINKNVSIFNNKSTDLTFHCIPEKEVYWNEYFDTDIRVIPTDAFDTLLYKVIMGDTSDNIKKLKSGFGKVAFQKFLDHIKPIVVPNTMELVPLAQWITSKFCEFTKMDEHVVLGQVLFNLKMTWLNLSVYNNTDYRSENGNNLLENMLEDINLRKNDYSYNKDYTLESFYGMVIK